MWAWVVYTAWARRQGGNSRRNSEHLLEESEAETSHSATPLGTVNPQDAAEASTNLEQTVISHPGAATDPEQGGLDLATQGEISEAASEERRSGPCR